jgi:Fe-S cluster assembly scaffold protein SufB
MSDLVTTLAEASASKASLSEGFYAWADQLQRSTSPANASAWAALTAQAFPTRSDEAFRFLDWTALRQVLPSLQRFNPEALPALQANAALSAATQGLPDWAEAQAANRLLWNPHYFSALANAASHTHTLHLSQSQAEPIELRLLCTGASSLNRLMVKVEAGVQAALRITFEAAEAAEAGFTHWLLDVDLGEGASLDAHQLINTNAQQVVFTLTRPELQAQATFNQVNCLANGALLRSEVQAKLLGEQAHCELAGLSLLTERSRAHQHIRLEHVAPNCTSAQTFKTVVQDEAQAEFDGTIWVHPQAQQTNAQQLSQNLLLSPKAKAFARPWLKIDADDVKCSHGATVGQLDPVQLFYLQSRGLGFEASKCLLTVAFAQDLLNKVADLPLRQQMELALQQQLGHHALPMNCQLSCQSDPKTCEVH